MRLTIPAALLLCAVLLFPGQAFADRREFADFTVDLPDGWTIERDGITTAFISADKSATMQVTVEPITRISTAKELAEAYAHELHGSTPEMEDNDPNYYSFDFNSPEGVESEASIVVVGRRFYLITITGRHTDFARMVESVLLSIQ